MVFAYPENATQDLQEEHTSQDSVQQERATQDPITQPEEKLGKRLYYTPELKLKLIHLCISESYQGGGDVRRKVTSIVIERKGVIEARKKLSGVAEAAATDLDQAIDMWIEIIERRRDQQSIDIEGKAEIKAEKAAAEVLRDNLTKSFEKKWDF
ncbi:hypothetical protein BGX38DRAFT_1146881 [Terfezia claveryi]|nr:hypothetical protein BGX38DRAFT_1146881 [Terfezia claveryi]